MTIRNKAAKLRRGRKFDAQAPIQSRLPTADLPHSRQVAGNGAAASAALPSRVVDAARDAISLESVADRILCGDAAAVLAQLPAAWCPCAVTSPPYWHTVDYGAAGQIGAGTYDCYLDELDQVWREVARALIANGKLCINVPLLPLTKDVSEAAFGPSHTRVLLDLYSDIKRRIEAGTDLGLFSLYIWEKQTTEKMFGSYPYPPNLYERNYIEFIAVFVKPGKPRSVAPENKAASRLTQEQWMDLTQQIWWMYPDNIPRLEGHPAPFPEALPNRLIAMYTFRGDIVLDPFCGSGTTSVAARRLGRRSVGIDLNPDFCRFADQRLAATPLDPRVLPARRPAPPARLFGSSM